MINRNLRTVLVLALVGASGCVVGDEALESDEELTEEYSNSNIGYQGTGDLHNGDRCAVGLNAYNVAIDWYNGHSATTNRDQFTCWYDSGNYCGFQSNGYVRVRNSIYYQGRCINFGCGGCW